MLTDEQVKVLEEAQRLLISKNKPSSPPHQAPQPTQIPQQPIVQPMPQQAPLPLPIPQGIQIPNPTSVVQVQQIYQPVPEVESIEQGKEINLFL